MNLEEKRKKLIDYTVSLKELSLKCKETSGMITNMLIILKDKAVSDEENPEACELIFEVLDEYIKTVNGMNNYMNKIIEDNAKKLYQIYAGKKIGE